MKLRPADKHAIEQHIAEFESATGVQAVVTAVARCDSYPEIPWRAFALGATLMVLPVCLLPLAGALLFHSTVLALVSVVGAGAALALLTILVPGSGRWLLPVTRADMEVRQYAQAHFLTRGLAAAEAGQPVLVLLAMFERRGVVIADPRLFNAAEVLSKAESALNAMLAAADPAGAVKAALGSLRVGLPSVVAPPADRLPDHVLEERGA